MSSSMASFVVRKSLRSASKLRHFSSLPTLSPSSLVAPRVLTPQTLTLTRTLSPFSVRFASSKPANAEDKIKRADDNLLSVLDDEIECAQEADEEPSQGAILPKDSPFEIIDNPGDQSIILKRQFDGETIQVSVFMNFEEEEEDDDEDDNEGEKTSDALQPNISMVISIDKGAGSILEFCCNLDSKDVEIESMAMKKAEASEDEGAYHGPEFSDLDESLQRALRKYLAARGIKPSLYEFLREYMMTKDDREYLVWLKNLKEFIEK
ncbi:uncharacterized protein A4U43_C05F15380 [Asparagus officinalis]|uniref:Mitochondrial glycoprotein family protein n=1 Tax=Asparagus officinalis TaxID=4686 RepID=A0A5P1ERS5_ASPOF|nr:uncharacterized protein At2g39795, mitochondrial-like [Asparagus officinalis]ONK68735.1 uncharacterized protein A4U43_C05F15380 [Asparagus officinalis]